MNGWLLTILLLMQTATPGTGTVSGQLLNGSGTPAANVRIGLSPVNDATSIVGLTQTDSGGHYQIAKVPAGLYYIAAGLVDSPTYLPGVSSRADANPISIRNGSALVAPDFRLLGRRYTGRVILEGFPANQIPPSLRLSLVYQPSIPPALGSNIRFAAGIAADGTFDFPNLPEGNYSAAFIGDLATGVIPQPQGAPLVFSITLDRDIDNAQFRIPLSDWLVTPAGTMKIEGVAPLPMVGITLTKTDRAIANTTRAERKGEFSAETFSLPTVPSGEYSVQLTGLPEGYSIKAMTADSVNLLTENLTVTPVHPPRVAITLSVASPIPGVRVAGQITSREQYRLPNVIQIRGAIPGLIMNTEILPDGTFKFPQVPPGTYNVVLTPAIDSASRTIVVGGQDPASVQVPLAISGLRKIWVAVTGTNVRAPLYWPILRPASPPGAPDIRATFNADAANRNPNAPSPNDFAFEFLNVQPGSYQILLEQQGPAHRILLQTALPIVVGDKDITGITLKAR